jgi:hypothetical protein
MLISARLTVHCVQHIHQCLEKSQQVGFTENLLAKMALELQILVSKGGSAAGHFRTPVPFVVQNTLKF